MRILFYTGYFKKSWNANNQIGIGGSEVAVVKIAEALTRFGWKVVVSGNVIEEKINGVEWLPTEKLHQKYFDQFDVIVGISYIHFVLEFEDYENAKKLFWIHNTDYHPWFRGVEIDDSETLLGSNDIDGFICLTNWHKEQWSQKYSLDPSRFHVIGNGIDTSSFIGHPRRVKNRFIWSSAPERGLNDLLDNWNNIREALPGASLHIYSPGYSVATIERFGREGLEGVEFMGTATQEELHYAMLQAEYWLYLTSYEETYCITALEMQYAGVVPITTPVAALAETVNSGIILPDNKQKWNEFIKIINSNSRSLNRIVTKSNKIFAKTKTWDQRAYEWKNIISSK
jgi:glycosyltransferase involved in cell wall biosynthesis